VIKIAGLDLEEVFIFFSFGKQKGIFFQKKKKKNQNQLFFFQNLTAHFDCLERSARKMLLFLPIGNPKRCRCWSIWPHYDQAHS
jgi:hypothetical protein